jgi:hypothetical protein
MQEFLKKIEKEIESTIAVDFDGVLHKNSKGYHDGTIYDEPVEGSKEALEILSRFYSVVIYTCKASEERPLVDGKDGKTLIYEWLDKWDLRKYVSDVTDRKPRALFYIDDKAIRFRNWLDALSIVALFGKTEKEDKSKY